MEPKCKNKNKNADANEKSPKCISDFRMLNILLFKNIVCERNQNIVQF